MSQEIAREIYRQFGGNQAMAMIGGTPVADKRALHIRFKARSTNKANWFIIELNGLDTYDISFIRVWGATRKVIKEYANIYCDQLREIFERETGLYLSL